jgi:arsenate reductase
MYGLPHCSTCQRAREHLVARGVEVRKFHDLKAEPLGRVEVEALARKVGGPGKLFSRRALKYREMKLHEQDLSDDDLLRLMAEEYTFVTRPVIVHGERATAGFSARRIDDLLA